MVESETEQAEGESERKRLTKRQWTLLGTFAVMNMLSTACISLQAPFYPAEAQKKGATVTENGLVFGIFELTVFLVIYSVQAGHISALFIYKAVKIPELKGEITRDVNLQTAPMIGKYISRIGPKLVICVCVGITSTAIICFGFLDKVSDTSWFVALSLVCRFFEGFGCSGFTPASFTIIASEFPDSVSTTFAALETFCGIGLLLGPGIGGLLYSAGGFTLPFVTLGAVYLFVAFVSYFTIPSISNTEGEEESAQNHNFGLLTLLKIPSLLLTFLSLALVSLSSGVLSATLEPHIRQFQLTPLETSSFFIIMGGVNAIASPIWGRICDRTKRPVFVTITGVVFNFLGFLLIGPASFLPIDPKAWVTIVGLVLQGIGFAGCIVSAFVVARQEIMLRGYPDNVHTNGVISGLWESMFSFGAWSGPAIAGVLYDNYGFRKESWLPLALSLAVGVPIFFHTLCSKPTLSISVSLSQLQPLITDETEEDLEEGEESPTVKVYGSTSHTEQV